uniref:RAG1 importin-binding domain-containing protein n=1 Tax=Amphimedon queenslandica TaxID=400682 RepID=A0A1X7U4H6_AMPQE
MSSSIKHKKYLDNHCRVCGKAFDKTRKYMCKQYIEILEVLGVDPSNDDDNVHPESFCNSCYLTAKRASVKCTSSSWQSITWTHHDNNSCLICDVKCIGGRPKKVTSGGRPTLLTQQIRSAPDFSGCYKSTIRCSPSLIEEQVATNVVTRLLHQSDSPLVKLPTGGQPLNLIKVSAPLVPSGKCTNETVRKRSNEIKAVRKM